MKQQFNRKILVGTLLCILALMLCAFASADREIETEGSCGTNAYYRLYKDGYMTISGSGPMDDYAIWPAPPYGGFINYIKVVHITGISHIGNAAFSGAHYMTEVKISDSVKSIGNNAFYECNSLTRITIPDGVTGITSYNTFDKSSNLRNARLTLYAKIGSDGAKALSKAGYFFKNVGDDMFYYQYSFNEDGSVKDLVLVKAMANCTNVQIPEGVTRIGSYAFEDCSLLTKVIIPKSLTGIDAGAFSRCSKLTELYLPDNITDINSDAFDDCPAIRYASIGSTTAKTMGQANYSFRSPGTDYDLRYFASSPDLALDRVPENTVEFTVPSEVNVILAAFEYCTNLTKVTIPNSVKEISGNSFNECRSLTGITIPGSVTSIGNSAFSYCDSLKNVVIQNGVKEIGPWAFSSSDSLTTITIPNSVTKLGNNCFYDCDGLKTVTLSENITSIGSETFAKCDNLAELTIPEKVTSIGNYAFWECNLKKLLFKGMKTQFNNPMISSDCVFYCYSCSDAEAYADANGYKIVLLDPQNDLSAAVISKIPDQTYTGKAITPEFTVTLNDETLTEGNDYTIKWKDNKKVGKATVTLTGNGKYSGEQKTTFKINPKGTKLSKLKGGKKSLTVKWKKGAKNIDGYEIQYSLKEDFSSKKTVKINGRKETKKEIKKLKKKKTYYVRIRTWTKEGKTKYYSEWSAVEKVKTK